MYIENIYSPLTFFLALSFPLTLTFTHALWWLQVLGESVGRPPGQSADGHIQVGRGCASGDPRQRGGEDDCDGQGTHCAAGVYLPEGPVARHTRCQQSDGHTGGGRESTLRLTHVSVSSRK